MRSKGLGRWVAAAAVVLTTAALGVAVPAAAATPATQYAPVDRPGPALDVPAAQLQRSLTCSANVTDATREPVLLLPGTTINSSEDFGFTYEPLFRKLGIPYCTSDSPVDQFNMQDMQVRAEYVTYAIRTTAALAGRRIAVLGHSQGGMIMRWSLRFWPDTRALVQDVVGIAGTNHGTVDAGAVCLVTCSGSFWQQRTNSQFTRALNSGQETFPGIDYTEIYSHDDEIVQPNLSDTGSSSLHGGGGDITNVAVQDLCPLDVSEHLLVGTVDPVASALTMDALTHDGPADPSRIPGSVCRQAVMPGTNPVSAALGLARLGTQVAIEVATAQHQQHEPKLECYVTAAGCGS